MSKRAASRSPRLPTELTVYHVATLRPQWVEWLATPKKMRRRKANAAAALVVDGADVAEIDAAGVQMLIALARGAETMGRPLRIDGASAPLRTACETLGLGGLLGANA